MQLTTGTFQRTLILAIASVTGVHPHPITATTELSVAM